MIAFLDETGGTDPGETLLADFAEKLRKHSDRARRELEAIAALPDGPAVYRRMRASGEIPLPVALVMRQLAPEVFAKLEGSPP